ncbi:glucoamylase family protein [Xanthomonas sp. NCPPB 2632]|uniref:glucoamylase family protein n=1 Tax=Xanthomonas sp. NCPPB 2632 TaxID=3240912 RepID=UPI0035185C6E
MNQDTVADVSILSLDADPPSPSLPPDPKESHGPGATSPTAIRLAHEHALVAWRYRNPSELREHARRAFAKYRKAMARASDIVAACPNLQSSLGTFLDNEYFLTAYATSVSDTLTARQSTVMPGQYREGTWSIRVLDVCEALATSTAAVVDKESLSAFFACYQRVQPLDLAELWCVPSLCALALFQLIEAQISSIDMLEASYAAEAGWPGEASISCLHSAVAALRFVANARWIDIVEGLSPTRDILAQDPARCFERMDIATRNSYLTVVSTMSMTWRIPEATIAGQAIRLSSLAQGALPDPGRRGHVGYFLIDDGVVELARALKRRPPRQASQAVSSIPGAIAYLGSRVVAHALCAGLLLVALLREGWPIGGALALAFLASVASYTIVGQLVSYMFSRGPHRPPLPRMDYRQGIPAVAATMVAVPCLLEDDDTVVRLLRRLESQYLRNRSAHIHFALLTDHTDAPTQATPGDQALLALATEGIRGLNERYGGCNGESIFHLFHRGRRYCPTEGRWMGWERKRGKVRALNRLLLDGDQGAFDAMVGKLPTYRFRYVICLDSDTLLPADAAGKLVATIDHPLVKPLLNVEARRVDAGYAIVQPYVATMPPMHGGTVYSRIWGGHGGLDHYSLAKADLYHDLFVEGSFIGKGIYDIEAFERCLAGRLPEGRILSHDLIEGCFARCTVATDITILDEYPAQSSVDMSRKQRWIRGDWQIAAWLGHQVPTDEGSRARNDLSLVSRYKIFDNLARSLVPPATLLALYVGMAEPVGHLMAIVALAAIFLPGAAKIAAFLVSSLLARSRQFRQPDVSREIAHSSVMILFEFASLPRVALSNLMSIVTTLWRLGVTHRHLLEWRASSQVAAAAARQAHEAVGFCTATSCISSACIGVLALMYPGTWPLAALCISAWMAAPLLARVLGRPPVPDVVAQPDADYLRRMACLSWSYFVESATEQNHWLPPDHVQEYPVARVAPRTSPTNIGLGLLSCCAAHDLGQAGLRGTLRRLSSTLKTLARMEHHASGHLFNWYDTRSLHPEEPRYVSAVDSGNYIGHLMVVRQFIREARDAPRIVTKGLQGLGDLFTLARESENVPGILADKAGAIASFSGDPKRDGDDLRFWLESIVHSLADGQHGRWHQRIGELAAELLEDIAPPSALEAERIERLIEACNREIAADFGVFFDPGRQLLHLGMDGWSGICDAGHYDMLASEARLAAYVAIAKGDVPATSWYALGRLHTESDGELALLSWSGSMFEYLMPDIVMPSIPGTLLHLSMAAAVRRQRRQRPVVGMPWGVSECGYADLEPDGGYCYQAFGIHSLALKPDLGTRRVIAPYASSLACLVDVASSVPNLRQLEAMGASGHFGFHEAVDFGEAGNPPDAAAMVREVMAHHTGMSLASFASAVTGGAMQERFLRDPELGAAALLLAERRPARCVLATR